MTITAYQLAERFTGTKEVSGATNNPLIVAMLQLDASWAITDEVAWCSAFVNFVLWLLRGVRSKSLAARSWLLVGTPIHLSQARIGWDVVILKRGAGEQPGADIVKAPGHVGFFAGVEDQYVWVLGGNQSNSVSLARFHQATVLGVRRLREE